MHNTRPPAGRIIIIIIIIIIIGASLSEPHTNRYYEKIAIVMYVCVCVSAIRRPRVVLVHVRASVRVVYLSPHARAHTNRDF